MKKLTVGAFCHNVDCTISEESFFEYCKQLLEEAIGQSLDELKEIEYTVYNDSIQYYFPSDMSLEECWDLIIVHQYVISCGNVVDGDYDPKLVEGIEEYDGGRILPNGISVDEIYIPALDLLLEVKMVVTQNVEEVLYGEGA